MNDAPPADEHSAALGLLLKAGWKDRGGMLTRPGDLAAVSVQEWDAVHYLCDEWDYAMDQPPSD